jgi:hypothetical protein
MRKFPGAFSRARFEVMAAQITVLTELRFIKSPWIISTGRVFAGSEPRPPGMAAGTRSGVLHNKSPT